MTENESNVNIITGKQKLKAYKEGKFLIFLLPEGKTVKYDLATKETIGRNGKKVKNLKSQLSGYNLHEVIDGFEDINYRKYLRFMLRYFINNGRSEKTLRREVDRIRNVGTFLAKLEDDGFEQFFAAGIYNIDPEFKYKLNEIPNELVKFCRLTEILLDDILFRTYNYYKRYEKYPDLFGAIMGLKCISLTHKQRVDILNDQFNRYNTNYFKELIEELKYNPIALCKYIDEMITYEAFDDPRDVMRELYDYCDMMCKISPNKYDKYPRNLLTSHQIATRNYNRMKTQYNEERFKEIRDSSLELLEWTYEDYKIIYPETTQEIKDEGVSLNHCVASYIDRVLNKECHIIFLRHKKLVNESLITLDVWMSRYNNIYYIQQSKGKCNRDPSTKEKNVINKYEEHINRQLQKQTEQISVVV